MNEHEHAANDEATPRPTQDEVAKKADAIYEKEDRPQGHAEQNWSDAQAQLQHGSVQDVPLSELALDDKVLNNRCMMLTGDRQVGF